MMDEKQIVKHALDDYQRITGLRSYIVEDNTVIQSASEKIIFVNVLRFQARHWKSVKNVQRKRMKMHARLIRNVFILVMLV